MTLNNKNDAVVYVNGCRMLVSIDFDGVITCSGYPDEEGFNQIRPYCKEAMDKLTQEGVRFILLTGRNEKYLPECLRLIKEWDLPIDVSTPNKKVTSTVFIDDRNLGCTGIDWITLYHQLSILNAGGLRKHNTQRVN